MNDEIEVLIKKADESIKGAKLLFDNGLFGFSVSRAYYSMFYMVSAILRTKGLLFSKHKAVIAAFGQYFIKTNIFEHKFHRYLIESFEQRQIGDYEVLDEITKETAQRSINKAIEFITAVKNFLSKTEE